MQRWTRAKWEKRAPVLAALTDSWFRAEAVEWLPFFKRALSEDVCGSCDETVPARRSQRNGEDEGLKFRLPSPCEERNNFFFFFFFKWQLLSFSVASYSACVLNVCVRGFMYAGTVYSCHLQTCPSYFSDGVVFPQNTQVRT